MASVKIVKANEYSATWKPPPLHQKLTLDSVTIWKWRSTVACLYFSIICQVLLSGDKLAVLSLYFLVQSLLKVITYKLQACKAELWWKVRLTEKEGKLSDLSQQGPSGELDFNLTGRETTSTKQKFRIIWVEKQSPMAGLLRAISWFSTTQSSLPIKATLPDASCGV